MEKGRRKYSQQLMKAYNENFVYNCIWMGGPISRADIARSTAMSPTSIGRIVDTLIDSHLIHEIGTLKSGMVGRTPTMLQVIPEGVLSIAIAVDYARVEAGIVDICGNISHNEVYICNQAMSQEGIINQIQKQVLRIRSALNADQLKRIKGIGISVPGVVYQPEGWVTSPQLSWKRLPLAQICNDLGFEVMVENAVKATATAEHMFGSTRTDNDYLTVVMGSGIGAAIMLGGAVFRGKNNIAGELGHISLDSDGILCDCGRRGCLQSTLCILGIERRTGLKYRDFLKLADSGNEKYMRIWNDVLEQLSKWMANLANLYDLPLIILYGEMLEDNHQVFMQIQERYKKYLWTDTRDRLEIRKAEIDIHRLPLLSAASVVFNTVLSSDGVIRS